MNHGVFLLLCFSEKMLVTSYAAGSLWSSGSNLSLNLKRKCSGNIAPRCQRWTDGSLYGVETEKQSFLSTLVSLGSSVMVGRFGVVGPLRTSPRTLRLEMDHTSLISAQNRFKEGGEKNQSGVIQRTGEVKGHTITRGHAGEGQVPEPLRTRSMVNLQRREGSSEYSELQVNLRHRKWFSS